LSVKWHRSGQKTLTARLKSLSTGAEDAGMQEIYLALKLPSGLSGML